MNPERAKESEHDHSGLATVTRFRPPSLEACLMRFSGHFDVWHLVDAQKFPLIIKDPSGVTQSVKNLPKFQTGNFSFNNQRVDFLKMSIVMA